MITINSKSNLKSYRDRIHKLKALSPDSSLQDLEPLKSIIGNARVVAIGEGSHFLREYWQLRQRLIRFLHEECGFNLFAMEYGFAEAGKLNGWMKGNKEDKELKDISPSIVNWGAGSTMKWLQKYNEKRNFSLSFAGIDISEAGGALLPALEPVRDYFIRVDTGMVPAINEMIEIAGDIDSLSVVTAITKWQGLSQEKRDKLSATLSRAYLRMLAAEPLYVNISGKEEYDVILRTLDGAVRTEYMWHVMSEFNSGTGLPIDMSARERYMADSIIWHLDHSQPGTRIILAAHNNHIQMTPVAYGNFVTTYPMGYFLRRTLGDNYCPIGVTSTDNHTAEIQLDAEKQVGFRVFDAQLENPIEGSMESFLIDIGLRDNLTLTEVRNVHDVEALPNIHCIRSQSAYVTTPIEEAFDAVISIPKLNLDDEIAFL